MFENFEMKLTTADPVIWLIGIFGRPWISFYNYLGDFLKDIFLPLRWRGIAFCKFSLFLKNGIGGYLCGCPVFFWGRTRNVICPRFSALWNVTSQSWNFSSEKFYSILLWLRLYFCEKTVTFLKQFRNRHAWRVYQISKGGSRG